MDLIGLGAIIRSVRRRRGWRQRDLADAAGVSTATISRIERGHARALAVGTLMRVAAALEIQLDLVPRWRGGDLDRMIGAGHGRMHEQFAPLFHRQVGWIAATEASFSIYGERGVIDVLAFHAARQMLLVIELKTELIDVQGLLSAVDRYRRLAPRVASERGWQAREVAAWVILRDTTTNRRRLAAHATVLRSALPQDGRMVRRWLPDPAQPMAALSFLPDLHERTVKSGAGGPKRVRVAAARSERPADRVGMPPSAA